MRTQCSTCPELSHLSKIGDVILLRWFHPTPLVLDCFRWDICTYISNAKKCRYACIRDFQSFGETVPEPSLCGRSKRNPNLCQNLRNRHRFRRWSETYIVRPVERDLLDRAPDRLDGLPSIPYCSACRPWLGAPCFTGLTPWNGLAPAPTPAWTSTSTTAGPCALR